MRGTNDNCAFEKTFYTKLTGITNEGKEVVKSDTV